MHVRPLLLVGVALSAAVSAPVLGQSTTVLAVTGDAAPDGNGVFLGFGTFDGPSLNDAGQVGFSASLSGTTGGSLDDSGVFRAGGVGGVVQVARGGQTAPGGGNFFSLSGPAINEAGQLAFRASGLTDAGGFSGIYRGDGTGAPVQIVRDGQAAPGGNGTFININPPEFNDAGQVAFASQLANTSGGAANTDNLGVFRGDGGSVVQIARRGQPVPGGNGTLDTFGAPAINAAGQAAFAATLANTSGGLNDSSGIYRGDGVGAPVQIARQGQTVPGANGTFARFDFSNPALNDAGQAAFKAALANTLGGTSDNEGIFRGDGATPVIQVAREGQFAPGGDGRFGSFGFDPTLNNANQVAFYAGLTATSGGTANDTGLFRAGGAGGTITVAREGQAAPGGNGTFSVLSANDLALNDAGQIIFVADLAGTAGGSADDRGLFLYDDTRGLLTVAREGDALLGSTITDLRFNGSTIYNGDERSGFNELGQVAYGFTLADGRRGIALYDSTPEPGSLALLGLAGVALVRRRRN